MHGCKTDFRELTFFVELIFFPIAALKGWPVVGFIPEMYKAMKRGGFNNFYHKLQQQHGPIYKMKGLGRTLDSFSLSLLCAFPFVTKRREGRLGRKVASLFN